MLTHTRKAYVETYGCQMNIADGEVMQGILARAGYVLVHSPEEADVILVNTCAIRDHAEQRVIGRVGELARIKQERPDVVIGVTGCMAQRMGTQLLERAAYVELVMGPDMYRTLPEALAQLRPSPQHASRVTRHASRERRALPVLTEEAPHTAVPPRLAMLEFAAHENYEGLEVHRTSRVSAWVPVQRGCNYRCTYCIVPYVRGPEKNRDPERILDEVRSLAEQGIPEVVLLGQTVNSYEHGEWNFARLLRAVARVDGIRRVRFTSPHPNDFTDDLVEVMAAESAVCKQLHLPVQSGHNRTLKRMLRRYTVETYLEKLERVRNAVPNIALSTDVIVAFPGETADEYQATLELMRTVRYDDAYLYKYSRREGTPATRLPSEQWVPDEEAQDRLERIIALHRGIQAEINRAEVGRTVDVLIERAARSAGDVLGRTEANKVVAFAGVESRIGEFTHVRLRATSGATFTGEEVHESAFRVA
ncbi:MAG: tRNA (N6-isopentenyl adenosine(37)-C2)-methylthiotransferase MiaB [Longimicrobiales bacterium]